MNFTQRYQELQDMSRELGRRLCEAELSGDIHECARILTERTKIAVESKQIETEMAKAKRDIAVATIQMQSDAVRTMARSCQWAKLSELVKPINPGLSNHMWWLHSNKVIAGRPIYNESEAQVRAELEDLIKELTGGR